jgi:hypothetical protein
MNFTSVKRTDCKVIFNLTEMKKISCFSMTAILSMAMLVSAGLSQKFRFELLGGSDHTTAFFITLQILLLIKYVAAITILTPAKININQLALGFLIADLLVGVLSIPQASFLVLPVPIIITQVLLLLIYKGINGHYLITLNTYRIPQLTKRLATEGL